jgi:hypothetical protein
MPVAKSTMMPIYVAVVPSPTLVVFLGRLERNILDAETAGGGDTMVSVQHPTIRMDTDSLNHSSPI